MFKDRVDNTTDDGHDCENNQVYQDHGIHLALHLATLAGSAARIENKLGIQTSVHDDADHPCRIPQHSTA